MSTMRRRVLLMDDDTSTLETATLALEARGFDVTISGRRHGRVDYITRLRPDAVVLGVRLPYLVADEVLHARLSHPVLKAIPVLIVSGADPLYVEDLARESGAAGYVRRADVRSTLAARVEGIFERSVAEALPLR